MIVPGVDGFHGDEVHFPLYVVVLYYAWLAARGISVMLLEDDASPPWELVPLAKNGHHTH